VFQFLQWKHMIWIMYRKQYCEYVESKWILYAQMTRWIAGRFDLIREDNWAPSETSVRWLLNSCATYVE
jgi:hypothetical protein